MPYRTKWLKWRILYTRFWCLKKMCEIRFFWCAHRLSIGSTQTSCGNFFPKNPDPVQSFQRHWIIVFTYVRCGCAYAVFTISIRDTIRVEITDTQLAVSSFPGLICANSERWTGSSVVSQHILVFLITLRLESRREIRPVCMRENPKYF